MPILPVPDYRPAFPFTFGHVQTLYPTLLRRTPLAAPKRERMETEDGDFLDIDHHSSRRGSSAKLAVISHGLEGNSRKKYMLGMASALTGVGWDVICLNFRGCSGEMNRLPRLYHSGVTDDLHRVLSHGLASGKYRDAALVGFSMGGNQTLKYLGEAPERVPAEVRCALTFSVPILLADSAATMGRLMNRVYMRYFMSGLHRKVRIKAGMFPEMYDTRGLDSMRTFQPFDDKYTAPVHGFSGADDYYAKCSAKQFLTSIRVPALLVQAQDDPFLPDSCYPYAEARANPDLFLEVPRHGGHVGFVGEHRGAMYWAEERTVKFLGEMLP
jgi:predicted alpha/beta-fold hydrolase